MENVLFTKKELLAQGFTVAQVKSLTPVDFKKGAGRGRPAGLYSQAQVDAVKSGAVVAAVTVETPASEPVASVEPAVDAVDSDLTDQDFAAVA